MTDAGTRLDPRTAGELLRLAVDAARAAAAELRRRHGQVSGLEHKSSPTDPVSDADRASERLLVERIAAERPGDGVLAEEGARRPSRSGLRWVLDPLDGTVNYLYGLPPWAVSVACEQAAPGGGWRAVVAAVHDGERDETFTAVRGRGAHRDGVRLRVNDPVPMARALVATGFAYDSEQRQVQADGAARLLPRIRDVRCSGSAALDLCWLAAGRVDGYYEAGPSRWDWAAGGLIATEAGARVTTVPLVAGDEVIAAGPALYPHLAAAVGGQLPAAPGAREPRVADPRPPL